MVTPDGTRDGRGRRNARAGVWARTRRAFRRTARARARRRAVEALGVKARSSWRRWPGRRFSRFRGGGVGGFRRAVVDGGGCGGARAAARNRARRRTGARVFAGRCARRCPGSVARDRGLERCDPRSGFDELSLLSIARLFERFRLALRRRERLLQRRHSFRRRHPRRTPARRARARHHPRLVPLRRRLPRAPLRRLYIRLGAHSSRALLARRRLGQSNLSLHLRAREPPPTRLDRARHRHRHRLVLFLERRQRVAHAIAQ